MAEDRTLGDFLTFVMLSELETPLESGVGHLTLRELIRTLKLYDLCECMEAGAFDLGEQEYTLRAEKARELIKRLDALLQTQAPSSKDVIEKAIADRLSAQLDRIITASVLRLPADLHTRMIRARALRASSAEPLARWRAARETLLGSRRRIELSVADLARAYERRLDMDKARDAGVNAIAEVRAQVTLMDEIEQGYRELEAQLRTLYNETLPLLDHAQRIIAELSRLRAALTTLEVKPPANIDEQMRDWEERLQAKLVAMRDDFAELPMIERDPTLVQAIKEVDELEARVREILNPIRPSVFKHRLDRSEELRRLVLFALKICTDRKDPFLKKQRHRGLGKSSLAQVLHNADLIDLTEFAQASELVVELHTPKGGELCANKRLGWGWIYRITRAGIEQAGIWLADTLDPDELCATLERADERRMEENKLKGKLYPIGRSSQAS